MKCFIINTTYKVIDDKAFVLIYGRLENKEPCLIVKKYRPYFFIKKSDLKRAKKIEFFDYEPVNLKTFDGKAVVKVYVNNPKDVPVLREEFNDAKIECYEADIRFTQRFLIDHKILSCCEVIGDYDYQEHYRVYNEPELKPAKFNPELKILSIDIETDSHSNKIYSIALASKDNDIVLITNDKAKNCCYCSTEKELLEKFVEQLSNMDPDVITGWNVIDFDLRVLYERCKRHNLNLSIGRGKEQIKLKIAKDYLKQSTALVTGRVVIDAISLIKSSFIKLPDYKLDTAAEVFVKDSKLLKFKHKTKELEELYKKNASLFAEYNLKDARLVLKILDKSGALGLALQRSMLTGLTLDRVSASIAALDVLYLMKSRERGLVCPTAKYNIKEKSIKGGYVMQPKPGLYDNIIVLDFKSLYPSIIRTFNIDPSSYVKNCKGKNLVKAPNNACFKNVDGILPTIIKELWDAREKARKAKNELERYAIKILMNSFFGVMANPNCRFFDLKIANAITHFGQYIVKLTSEKIKEKGYEVIYIDTDGLFVNTKVSNTAKAEKIGYELQTFINNYYKDFIKKQYHRESFLELEYEKCYTKFLMPKLRNTSSGAKKRYAGLRNNKLEITGLEFVRGDWTELAKRFQFELLTRVFRNKKIEEYIIDFVKQLMRGKFDKMLVYRKSLRKDIKDYAVNPPHVKAAKKLETIDSNVIHYVMTKEGPEPVQCIKHEIDYDHYVKKQVKPIANSILTFFNKDFDEIMSRQKCLKDF